ncbi:Arm DNA-binding domain-containing protein [Asticcacaulis sp. BYS171W]|uniref:Arm DNA-binding domain-containing protein n=1 Tax=Asticcacaulis aquaticus TaxID=2984212 RepID=A0ABT5HQG1_9CAUL|nr:Arm DNA-binding domain-containing protein [Asticcacaulis aquaticus]MDC7682224.1 Arm DNA-binding domain-containing protein [Asticcacaulis aquaticus]
MALTDIAIRGLKPTDRDQKVFDGEGLYLLIKRNGSRIWRYKYYHLGKEQLLTFGAYPLVSLRDARLMRDEAKRQKIQGIEPPRLCRRLIGLSYAANSKVSRAA